MIAHTSLAVSDYPKSKAFYCKALAPLEAHDAYLDYAMAEIRGGSSGFNVHHGNRQFVQGLEKGERH